MPGTSLILTNLRIGYGHAVVQDNLNHRADCGKMICLLGQNGCGKSTLLRTLAGFLPAQGGQCLLATPQGQQDLLAMRERERAKWLSVVLTDRPAADHTTVRDVVAMGRYPYASLLGGLRTDDNRRIDEALLQTGMTDMADKYFSELSDGEKQRVLISKALAQDTPFVLLDEPTAHLDLPNRIRTMLLLKQLAANTQRCILISTHELDLALQTADEIWLMRPHEGIETGTPESLIASGAFQRAFANDSFQLVADGRSLRVVLS